MTSRSALRTVAGALAALVASGCIEPVSTPTMPVAGRSSSATDLAPGMSGQIPFAESRVIVRFRDGADQEAVAAKHRGKKNRDLLVARAAIVDVAAGDEKAAVARFNQDPDVEFAEPDYLYIVSPCEVGNCEVGGEGFLGYKWDLHNVGNITVNGALLAQTGVADADIDWAEMRDALGMDFSGSAVVGIVDSGIRGEHLDLVGRVIGAKNFASQYPETLIQDRDGHGTHVAGIAAANGTNNIGVPGVAYGKNIKLLNAKACERYLFPDGIVRTSCPSSSVANAITWAVDNGANVINLSLGGGPFAAVQLAALQYARSRNVLPICASGNDNGPVSYPARYAECLAVGATNWSNQKASYSNFGSEVFVSAPGGDGNPLNTAFSLILSANGSAASSTGSYVFKAGTSMATPQVVGLAAMLWAGGMHDADAIAQRLKESADDLGAPGWDPQFGWGRINAYRAMTGKDPYAPPVVSTPADGYVADEGSPILFDGSASLDPNNHPITFRWTFGDGFTSTLATLSHAYADNGSFAATLFVTDESNRTTSKSSPVTIANVAPSVGATLTASVASGQSASFVGTFSDPGVNDAPWAWSIDWGNGAITGTLLTQTAVTESRRYCREGSYTVRFGVTDKDGGVGGITRTVAVTANAIAVQMPGSFNVKSNGSFPVKILGTADFDASSVDAATVTLGNGVLVQRKNNGTLHASLEDVNGDGKIDLTLHFSRPEMVASGINASTTTFEIRGTLGDGCTRVLGSATVKSH